MQNDVSKTRNDTSDETSASQTDVIGQPIRRREDLRLVRGQSRYVDDLAAKTNASHMVLLRSPHAYAEIRSIDVQQAQGLDGVVAIYTAADLQGIDSIPCDWVPPGMTEVPLHPILATEKVLYAGQPIAAIIAEDLNIAKDALELISVDYLVLKPVLEQEAAMQE